MIDHCWIMDQSYIFRVGVLLQWWWKMDRFHDCLWVIPEWPVNWVTFGD